MLRPGITPSIARAVSKYFMAVADGVFFISAIFSGIIQAILRPLKS